MKAIRLIFFIFLSTQNSIFTAKYITPQLGAQIRRLKSRAKRREPTCLCPSERSERLYWIVMFHCSRIAHSILYKASYRFQDYDSQLRAPHFLS